MSGMADEKADENTKPKVAFGKHLPAGTPAPRVSQPPKPARRKVETFAEKVKASVESELEQDRKDLKVLKEKQANQDKFNANQEKFNGKIIHSSQYKYPEKHGLLGKDVVVVGIGNSGADIVTEFGMINGGGMRT